MNSLHIEIRLAESDEQIAACAPVMLELRPYLLEESFVDKVRAQMDEGYRLVYLTAEGKVRAVAGFRLQHMLSRGAFLYVDDLVTAAKDRSGGWGKQLLRWLIDYARDHGCQQLDLDSGVQRSGAHRFYFREGLHIASYHFTIKLAD